MLTEGTVNLFKSITPLGLSTFNRADLIEFLCWNDRNGTFRDADAAAEGFDPLTRADALDLALAMLAGE
jgi:hypothetical protein